jgi:hypothetical protein
MGKNGLTNTDIRRYKGKATDPVEGKNTHALGDNLRVRTQSGRHDTYVFIYRAKIGDRRGKKITLTFGPTTLDIKDAQQWAREQMTLLANGKDPYQELQAKRKANDLAARRAKTLGQLAQEYYNMKTSPDEDDHWSDQSARNMRYVLKNLLEMPIAKMCAKDVASTDVEDIINEIGKRAPVQAHRYRNLIEGAMDLGKRQKCYEGKNPAKKKRLNLKIKHTSVRHYGWHYDELPRLWKLLCEAETDCKYDGMLTTAQVAKAFRCDRTAVLNLIKYQVLPAKQCNTGKISFYLIDPADVLKYDPSANINVESSFDEKHLAIQVLKLLLLTSVRFDEANGMPHEEIDWVRRLWIIPPPRVRRGGGSWAESQFVLQTSGILQAKYDTKFMRAVLGHSINNGLDYIYRSDANLEKPTRILLNDWANYLVHGSSKSPVPAEPVSAEIVDLSIRRAASA